MNHTYFKCTCYELGCQFCDGGLGYCTRCQGFEGTLPQECPGKPMFEWQKSGVWKGVLEYQNGAWTYGLTEMALRVLEARRARGGK